MTNYRQRRKAGGGVWPQGGGPGGGSEGQSPAPLGPVEQPLTCRVSDLPGLSLSFPSIKWGQG